MRKHFISLVLAILSLSAFSQSNVIIEGYIYDENGKPAAFANIFSLDGSTGTSATAKGYYKLNLPEQSSYQLIFSTIELSSDTVTINREPKARTITFNKTLKASHQQLNKIEVTATSDASTMRYINTDALNSITSSSSGVEAILKTLPGVSSNNEMSSQYSVRGGNFDENLIYINDIEVYRPQLIRAGQQEGLSIVNPNLVSAVSFSAGGFAPKYGDKMSSVLDIRYKKPNRIGGSASASLLGVSAHLEGASKNRKLSFIGGYRYQTNRLLLSTLDTKGEYNPSFHDFQTYISYNFNPKLELSFLGNITQNRYLFIPETRVSAFGTQNNALQVNIFYEGSEVDRFTTLLGALNLSYTPSKDLQLKVIGSAFNSYEEETFDIWAAYRIDAVDNTGSSNGQNDSSQYFGIGSFLDHARNFLDATVLTLSHKGYYRFNINKINWGLTYKNEAIIDNLNEWRMVDSAGYSIPYSSQDVNLFYVRNGNHNVTSHRITSFASYSRPFNINGNRLSLLMGARTTYWSYNDEFLLSPRGSISFVPLWEKRVLFKLAGGVYFQQPFYKELRYPAGDINPNIKAQKSTHVVLGADRDFRMFNRPFRFISEIYYKQMDNLIPYQINNVRIIYAGENLTEGYAGGVDFKINGEFVPGIDSWLSISLMQTQEKFKDQTYITPEGAAVSSDYFPRPTDQRFNLGMYFQDYLPGNPTYRMQLTLMYGSGLPYTIPNTQRYENTFRMPPYRRVDLGLFKSFLEKNKKPNKTVKSLIAGVEIFNLFDIRNTISYLWVRTVSSSPEAPSMFAVPNYLTGRRVNFKITAEF